ncbi:MAG: type II toxin-antitoxin system VapC family toxin, partial [Chloroflexi bacterium]|nr:type II toxin-antitoxin system VapC family toxin [Chloroflexota bacterium]
YRAWLENVMNQSAAYAVSDIVLSGFLRVVTHPRVFAPPSNIRDALAFAGQIRQQPNAVVVMPGNRHWTIFTDLCKAAGARGNLIPDAFLAALAIESGSEWVTTDRDFSRFPGLNWRHPLEE